MPVKICCVIRKSSALSPWKEAAKRKAIIVEARTDHVVPGGMKGLSRQIFIVGYLQFVEIQSLLAALCSTVTGLLTVARNLYRRLSVGYIGTPLKNGSVDPSLT